MQLRKGDMFQHKADVLLVTANSYVTHNGVLVMGRGAAKQANDLYQCAEHFGWLVNDTIGHKARQRYGVIMGDPGCYNPECPYWLGIFQVKYHWRDEADLKLIEYSALKLTQLAIPDEFKISLNFPGIGNGRLRREDVLPLLEGLPGNVTVWEL